MLINKYINILLYMFNKAYIIIYIQRAYHSRHHYILYRVRSDNINKCNAAEYSLEVNSNAFEPSYQIGDQSRAGGKGGDSSSQWGNSKHMNRDGEVTSSVPRKNTRCLDVIGSGAGGVAAARDPQLPVSGSQTPHRYDENLSIYASRQHVGSRCCLCV